MLLLLIRIFHLYTERKNPSHSVDRKNPSEDHSDGWTVIMMAVILLPEHPASFEHNFVSGMPSFYFSESQDATV